MKNITKLFAFAVVILGFSATSFGQLTGSLELTATAKGNILQGVDITQGTGLSADLNFGDIYTDGSTGTVTVANTSSTTATGTGGATPVATTSSAALFTLTGPANQAFTLTVLPTTLTVSNGADDMVVTGISAGAGVPATLGSGTVAVYVGGVLTLVGGESVGTYSTTDLFTVTVNW